MKKTVELVWISGKIEPTESDKTAKSAAALGISKSEFLRRALRVATPILLATPTAGVKIRVRDGR